VASLVGATGTAVVQAGRAELETRRTAEVATFLLGLLSLPYPYEAGTGHDRSLRSLLDSGVARPYLVSPDRAGGVLRSAVLFRLGDLADAERTAAQAIDILGDSGLGRVQLAHAHGLIGRVRLERGDVAGAEASFRRQLAVRQQARLSEPEIGNSYADLAEA